MCATDAYDRIEPYSWVYNPYSGDSAIRVGTLSRAADEGWPQRAQLLWSQPRHARQGSALQKFSPRRHVGVELYANSFGEEWHASVRMRLM